MVNKTDKQFSVNFDTYLLDSQQKAFHQLGSRVQEYIKGCLLTRYTKENIEKARLVLDIAKKSNSDRVQTTLNLFLEKILWKEGCPKEPLQKLWSICDRGAGNAFFNYISTKKSEYHPTQTLYKIIDIFKDIVSGANQSDLPHLLNLPIHEEDKDDILSHFKNNPTSLGSYFLAKSKEIVVRSQTTPIVSTNLEDLLKSTLSASDLKSACIQYLSSLPDDNRLPMGTYNKFFNLIQNDERFPKNQKALLIKLILLTTSSIENDPPLLFKDLQILLEETASLLENCGIKTFNDFCTGVINRSYAPLHLVLECCKTINFLFPNHGEISPRLELFAYLPSSSTLNQFLGSIQKLIPFAKLPSETNEEIELLFERFQGKNDPNVMFPISLENLSLIKNQFALVQRYCQELKRYSLNQLVFIAGNLRTQNGSQLNEEALLKMIAIGRLAIRIQFAGKYPNSTQILSVLALLANKKSDNNGSFAQIKTGEGKTFTQTLLAFVLKMQGKNVHIVSSSPSLSIRDQSTHAQFFSAFGIKTSHICDHHPEKDQFNADILYGVGSDFQFALMEQMLDFTKLFSSPFNCVIIDEVDNLTLDTGLNGTRLSIPSPFSVDWVYEPILEFVKKHFREDDDEKLQHESTINDLKTFLREFRGGRFVNFVQNLSEDNLKNWILSAHQVYFKMHEKVDYTIEERENFKGKKTKQVFIVDRKNTGKVQYSSRWGHSLHAFAEVKHDIEVSQETLTPISLNASVFYPFYTEIYGLTGTLGSKIPRQELKDTYKIDSFDVPTHTKSKRDDQRTKILASNEEHLNEIVKEVFTTRKEKRPILLLCETIRESEEVATRLKKEGVSFELYNELQQKDEREILEVAGSSGAVTIATNNAGRGTDIILHPNCVEKGLHVVLLFYPDSDRTEQQARGRAGRRGQAGSSIMILSAAKLGYVVTEINEKVKEKILHHLNQKRQQTELGTKQQRISTVHIQRDCFNLVKQFYSLLGNFKILLTQGEGVFRKFSSELINRKVIDKSKIKQDFSDLSPEDASIAKRVLKLLQEQENTTSQWTEIFKEAGKRIIEQMKIYWTLHFFQASEELISSFSVDSQLNGLEANDVIKVLNALFNDSINLNEIFQEIEAKRKHNLQDSEDKLRREINRLYDVHQSFWKHYLNSSGAGLITYLDNITSIKLSKGMDHILGKKQEEALPLLPWSEIFNRIESPQRSLSNETLPSDEKKESLKSNNGKEPFQRENPFNHDFWKGFSDNIGNTSNNPMRNHFRDEKITLEDGTVWKPKNTRGYGSCSLHAILGSEINGQFVYQCANQQQNIDIDIEAKMAFITKLETMLTNETVHSLYTKNLYSLLREFHRQKRGNEIPNHEGSLIFERTETGKRIYHSLLERDLKDFIDNDVRDLLEDQALRRGYLEAFIDTSYYLSDHEIEMAAYLFGKKIMICEYAEGAYHVRQEVFNRDSPDFVLIFHSGIHYERCVNS